MAGYVGRVGPEKNLAWLCEAMAKWCVSDRSAYFAVIGPSLAYGPTLRKIFEDAGVGDRLLLPGTFLKRDLADVYAALDVFTFTSLSDTQGIVLAEAMASSLPIVALDAPGAREAVSDGVNGFLLPHDVSNKDFAWHVARIFADGSKISSMSNASKLRSADYDRVRTARRMLELYSSLIENPVASECRRPGRVFDRFAGRLEAEWKLIFARAAAIKEAIALGRRGTACVCAGANRGVPSSFSS